MANKTTPMLSDYWMKSTVTEANHSTYHSTGWLGGGFESFVPEVDVPMLDNSNVVYFESHLIVGLRLPPGKFLVAILNFLRCELVHLNPGTIDALSCFTMLCKCWLRIALDTSLLWYFYYPARYDKTVFSRIMLLLHRHRRKEYLDATFKGCWKGASGKWFLVDMHVPPNGQTSICCHRTSMISGENRR
jgi:hypothetical protein